MHYICHDDQDEIVIHMLLGQLIFFTVVFMYTTLEMRVISEHKQF